MIIGIYGQSNSRFRLTDRTHSEELTEAQPFFDLTEGEMTFRVEQTASGIRKNPIMRFLKSILHFTRVIWSGFFGNPTIFTECSPILLTADVELKTTRYREQTLVFTPGAYAPDTHDYVAPKIEGGKDFTVTPTAYKVDEEEVSRRVKETLTEKLGASTVLLLVPVLLMLAAYLIPSATLGVVSLFAAIVLYPIIPLMLIFWYRQVKRFRDKVADKAVQLNEALEEAN